MFWIPVLLALPCLGNMDLQRRITIHSRQAVEYKNVMALKGTTLKEEPCTDKEFTHKELDDCLGPAGGHTKITCGCQL